MARPRFRWDAQGYIEFMNSEEVVGYLEDIARDIASTANSDSLTTRPGVTNFAYKQLSAGRKPVFIIHTASWQGAYEQSKNRTLKKALMKRKEAGG